MAKAFAEKDMGARHQAVHPLDPLVADEIRLAAHVVREANPDLERLAFAVVVLADPPKEDIVAFMPGDPIERRAKVVVLDRATGTTFEGIVSLERRSLESWQAVAGVQPPIMREEMMLAAEAARRDSRFVAALRRRGIEDLDRVQIDPLAAGHFDHYPQGRRILWATPYLLEHPGANAYARPIENVRACIDLHTGEVLEVVDGEAIPFSTARGEYDERTAGGFREDLTTLDIVQPDGPSFTVAGQVVRWQKWQAHVALHPVDGLVLSDLRYDGRHVLYRASVAEMVVPYGDPHDGYYWRSYFDAGEYGLGKTTNSLELGCDCLGEIYYFDAVLSDSAGEPETIVNAVCMHEEDQGILWKHFDRNSGTSQVRRSRRLVLSHIATVGNYDYGFYWSLYQDGSIDLEIKLTGIVLTRGVRGDEPLRHANRIAPDLAAPHHQHLFSVRLDMAIDGFSNTVYEVDLVPAEQGSENPYGNATEVRQTRIERESAGRRFVDPLSARTWRIVNESRRNAVGDPVGYKLVPFAGPLLLAGEDSSVGRRAGFARAHLWVTRYAAEELHAAGDYPNQHPGGAGLPEWVKADRELVDTDVVLWHTLGTSHAVRPEDWPVMPVERVGFALRPFGFFDRNPSLDVPSPHADSHCHPAKG